MYKSRGNKGTVYYCHKLCSAGHLLQSHTVDHLVYLGVLCTCHPQLTQNLPQSQNIEATALRYFTQVRYIHSLESSLQCPQSKFQPRMLHLDLHTACLSLLHLVRFEAENLPLYHAKVLVILSLVSDLDSFLLLSAVRSKISAELTSLLSFIPKRLLKLRCKSS